MRFPLGVWAGEVMEGTGNRDVLIEIKELTYVYNPGTPGERSALQGVSGNILKGEFLAVIGANGSGKSTLARHLNAILSPQSGTVLVAGMDTGKPENIWSIRRQVGMVFQNPDNQLVAALVEEDVAFGPENLAIESGEIRCRVEEALALVGLLGYRQRPPHLLSGGQKQRLAIAGVLAMKPACLVLDEPTAMLDPSGRRGLTELLKRLSRDEGITIILVTHFMEEAAQADRIWAMSEGRVVMQGTPVEVFRQRETLRASGLALPGPAELAWRLRTGGFHVPRDILTVEDMVAFLC